MRQTRYMLKYITPELIDSYIGLCREIKQNEDETINHALTPIIKNHVRMR